MFCAISGTTPHEPVISAKSGHLFERRLVEKFIEVGGKCPITDIDLAKEDLIPIVLTGRTTPPRPAAATSIPNLLQLFQNEWDAQMLETFTLKKHLDIARKELANALYQHDAACRVIARVVKERDQAREALANAQSINKQQAQQQQQQTQEDPNAVKPVLPAAVVDELESLARSLSQSRKKRAVSRNLATNAAIASYECKDAQQLHGNPPGIMCLSLCAADDRLMVTGGNDGNVVVFNRATSKIAASLVGHSSRVNSVALANDGVVVSGSADRTARIWTRSAQGAYSEKHKVTTHTDEITAVALHPTQHFAVTASRDSKWALHQLSSAAAPLITCDVGSSIGCGMWHPDGLLVGVGDQRGVVSLWDAMSGVRAMALDAHQGVGGVSSLAFSENGYMIATAGSGTDTSVKLWDLRKQMCLHTLRLEAGYVLRSLAFDNSGSYLAVGGSDVRVFAGRTLTHVKTFTEHAGPVTGVVFGTDAQWLASSSTDRTVRFWSAEAKA